MKQESFKASWWLRGGHGQTIWPSFTRKIRLDIHSENLDLPDGDFVRLDWVGDGGPIVVVLPGLQGSVQSSYARGLLRACQMRGWRAVLLNYRGRGEPNRLPYSYHCGMTTDLDYLVHRLRQLEPMTRIGVVGYSVGANICLKWLGEYGQRGEALPVAAAVGVSAPFHLGHVTKRIEKGFSRLYQWRLLRSLRSDLKRKMKQIDLGLELTRKELRRLKSFYKFDNRVSAPMNGFKDAEDYYAKTRTDLMLGHVNIPTLLLSARNDPMVPASLLPQPDRLSPSVTMEVSNNGGHMGFISGRWPWAPRFWLEQRVPDFLATFLATAVPPIAGSSMPDAQV